MSKLFKLLKSSKNKIKGSKVPEGMDRGLGMKRIPPSKGASQSSVQPVQAMCISKLLSGLKGWLPLREHAGNPKINTEGGCRMIKILYGNKLAGSNETIVLGLFKGICQAIHSREAA
eukprot:1137324-Pelagomonas_calceolata.AAC.4